MTNSPQRYAMNFGWVWGPDNPLLDKVARLALNLRGADPEALDALLGSWLAGLDNDGERGRYFQGGFGVEVLSQGSGAADIVFSSGGQDVADSLGYAVDSFCDDVLRHLTAGTATWTELPLE
ncbi:hypothetical protein JOF48_002875 [Arthrobacter stackebrandtii]|uniref:Uncharacterized protein n=1 Tax=Arthrobacter stackebrandtii TaxID=272161 RepID=A0ABS4YZ55_9MICC|nr:hypothetical protein [Arthrobacter stackebrandtii]MBP2414076.1 hypothetical protein [Arthrobacter stackebrandtii]PYG99378.1 hypothetical protein CVV67_15805 [Arthrobacter stackebrandtii]